MIAGHVWERKAREYRDNWRFPASPLRRTYVLVCKNCDPDLYTGAMIESNRPRDFDRSMWAASQTSDEMLDAARTVAALATSCEAGLDALREAKRTLYEAEVGKPLPTDN